MILWTVIPIIMMIIGIVSFTSDWNDFDSGGFDNLFDSSRSPIMSFIPFLIAFVGVAVCGCITTNWAAKIARQVEEELQKTCDEASRLHSGVSFHVRKERYITGHGSNFRSATSSFIEGEHLHFNTMRDVCVIIFFFKISTYLHSQYLCRVRQQ